MKLIKGLALSLLSFVLFLSLSIFGLALTLNYTILNPDFVVSELDKLDVPSLTEELISKQIPQEEKFMAEALNDAIADLEPWIKEQASTAIYSSYDYLMGNSQTLSLAISLEPVKEYLRDNLRPVFLQSPPPQLQGIPPTELDKFFNEFYQEISEQIPPTFEFNESMISPEILSLIEQVRQAIGYFQLGYKALIGFILLLILGIILINHNVRGATRGLGTIFVTYGAIEYLGILATKYFSGAGLSLPEVPPSLQAWISQFFSDFLAPLEMFSIGLLVVGIVLIIVSFVYKPSQTSF